MADAPQADAIETNSRTMRIAGLTWTGWAPWLCDIDAQRAHDLAALRNGRAWWKHERIGFTLQHLTVGELAWPLADLCCSLWPHRPFKELIPHPPPLPDLQHLLTATRGLSSTGLRERGIEDFADLATRNVPDLHDARGWGEGRVRRLVAALIEASLHDPRAVPVGWPGTGPCDILVDARLKSEPQPARYQTVLDDLAIIAEWHRLCGAGQVSLLEVEFDAPVPTAVTDAQRRLRELTAQQFMEGNPASDPIGQIAAVFDSLPDSERAVARRRVLTNEPPPPADQPWGGNWTSADTRSALPSSEPAKSSPPNSSRGLQGTSSTRSSRPSPRSYRSGGSSTRSWYSNANSTASRCGRS